MGTRRLTVAARDLWLLAASSVRDDLPAARDLAERAYAVSGPDRYETLMDWMGVRFCGCDVLPRGWVFYATDGRHERLVLLHPDAQEFLLDTVETRVFLQAAQEQGQGLMPMAPLLTAMLMANLTVPDTLP